MKTMIRAGIVILILVGVVGISSKLVSEWWRKRQLPSWRTEPVEVGGIKSVVNSTGTVKPVMSVQIGAFVSGPIDPETPLVEFNQEVKKGDVLAIIDQRIYKADVARDQAAVQAAEAGEEAARASLAAAHAAVDVARAAFHTRLAEVERAKAQLKQAENSEDRAQQLAAENSDFISTAEMDSVKFNRMQLQEQVNVAMAAADQSEASILQAESAVAEAQASVSRASATVAQTRANKIRSELSESYSVITSPVDGIVIDRKIEPGQTLAATFQTPELFVIAPNMREEVYIHASVDEADIGLIREAQRKRYSVEFTVDAYPDDLFEGSIKEIRFSSTTTQNVVTYPVIVSASNPDLKLLPGMTASISFQVDEVQDVLKVPNAALRFYPIEEHVHEDDKEILDGASRATNEEDDTQLSAAEQTSASRNRNRRHVWVQRDDKLRAIEIVMGLNDSKFTEVVSGDVKQDMELVIGIQNKSSD